jgi:cell division protein FtsA
MVGKRERYLVGLDVGTSKVAAVVGEMTDDDRLDVIGIGLADARGVRRGVVVNLEAAVESIKKAIEEAELTAGLEIDTVHLARRRCGCRQDARDHARGCQACH